MDKLKTLEEISEIYSISRWTIYRIMKENGNRVHDYIGQKIGKQWRFSLQKLEAVAA